MLLTLLDPSGKFEGEGAGGPPDPASHQSREPVSVLYWVVSFLVIAIQGGHVVIPFMEVM